MNGQEFAGRVQLRRRRDLPWRAGRGRGRWRLVAILHAGVVVGTHVQRLRADQAPRARVKRKARDATMGPDRDPAGQPRRPGHLRRDNLPGPGAFANAQGRSRRKNSAIGYVS